MRYLLAPVLGKAVCFSLSLLHQNEYQVGIACPGPGYYKPVNDDDVMINTITCLYLVSVSPTEMLLVRSQKASVNAP